MGPRNAVILLMAPPVRKYVSADAAAVVNQRRCRGASTPTRRDGSLTRAVAKSLLRDGVSGRNAVRFPVLCASRRVFPRPRITQIMEYQTTAYRRSGFAMLNKKPPRLFLHVPGEVDIDAALITHGKECHTRTAVKKALYWMSAHIAGDPADALRRRNGRGSGRRERRLLPKKIVFKQVPVEEFKGKLQAIGFPPHFVLAVAEVFQMLYEDGCQSTHLASPSGILNIPY
ncbi:hypothetical protein C8J57DRAFT_1249932 [Mycena rebaudengoi]|nr:hypothetical protein C8J57DRAFT_1249932 [Mycena rebaudengoi]